MFGGILILPLYMQIVHGASPTEAGLLMLPMVLGMMTGALGLGPADLPHRPHPDLPSGRLRADGRRPAPALDHLGRHLAVRRRPVHAACSGLGLGNCMQPLLLIMQSAVPPSEIGVATSSATFFRQIGGTLGVAVFLSVLFSTVGANIADHSSRPPAPTFQPVVADPTPATPAPEPAARPPRRCRTTPRSSRRSPRRWPTRSSRASPTSMDLVFLMGAGSAWSRSCCCC